MSTADLSLVSKTLCGLLQTNMARIADGSGATVTCGYPDMQKSASRTINLHLYHVAEDQFRRNLPGPGSDRNNVATTPLALTLYYILTAHHTATDSNKAWEVEQQIIGYALKTLHDFPTITDATQMSDSQGTVMPVLVQDLQDSGNIIDVILRPLTPEDAVTYWSAEQEQPVRVSAHYEVRTVLMEPEESRTSPGIVYSVGQTVRPRLDLSLTASSSEIHFHQPDPVGSSLPPTISVSPARPALDSPPIDTEFLDNGKFTIAGTGLTSGLSRRLVVRTGRWLLVGVPFGEIAVEPGPVGPSTSTWGLDVGLDRLSIDIVPQLGYIDENGSTAIAPVFPGHYSAALEIVVGHRTVGTQTREITQRSNEVVFTVTPRIARADAPVKIPGTPGALPPENEDRDRITIHVSPAVALDLDATNPANRLNIQLSVDGIAYERVGDFDDVPALNDGTFTVAANSVTFQPIFDVTVSVLHSVRMSVEGADAQPFWIEV